IAAEPTVSTPESYLGSGRAENFANGLITKGTHDFTLSQPGENELSYGGDWQITEQPVTAKKGARLALNFGARRVYLVLGSPGKSRRVKVLLDGRPISPADDEPTIVEIVGRYMERAGFQTYTAPDGYKALDAVTEHRPDLVVLDVMLPGIDGIEVMERLQERSGPPIAVILLTARGEESDRLVGLRHGADDYVVKPFSPAELVARVEAVMRRVSPPAEEDEGAPP